MLELEILLFEDQVELFKKIASHEFSIYDIQELNVEDTDLIQIASTLQQFLETLAKCVTDEEYYTEYRWYNRALMEDENV